MLKNSVIILMIVFYNCDVHQAQATVRDDSQFRESELEDLIKSLLERINAKELSDRDSKIVVENKSDTIQKNLDDDESNYKSVANESTTSNIGENYEVEVLPRKPGAIVNEVCFILFYF